MRLIGIILTLLTGKEILIAIRENIVCNFVSR